MKEIFKIAKIMYNVNTIEKIPIEVLVALEQAKKLCELAGGELISRQVISSIIVTTDTLDRYDPESMHYVGIR